MFNWLLSHGKYGVQAFFVISGFIIPYSLYRANYQFKDYFKFLYKRVLRLHPPYLIALFITLLIAGLSYRIRHLPNPETWQTVLESVFYLHIPADNQVFWTLRIEAEYYVFMGLFFLLLQKFTRVSLLVIVPVLLLISRMYLSEYNELPRYLCFFLTGTAGYLIYLKKENLAVELIALCMLSVFSFWFYAVPAGLVSLTTTVVILFSKRSFSQLVLFPGEISYSLYLIHFLIGSKFINIGQRYFGHRHDITLFLLAFVLCGFLAWIFWLFIERPSALLSNRARYGDKLPAPTIS